MQAAQMQMTSQAIEERVDQLLRKLTLREKVAMLSGADAWRTVAIDRLGIPALAMTDGPHGVRSNRAEAGRIAGETTAFPTGVSLAASWNPALIERVGEVLADETHAMGCDILLGPCVNIVRHPLAGRNFEAYSEDPYLAGQIGIAWVKGVQSRHVGASLKHFACNNQEIERGRGNSVVDERTLREIYLAQFETIVKEAQPWTVMCSYNRINGAYASQHQLLLKEVLKGEWGFEGAVVSDWGANHTIVESVQGGLDIEMPGPAKYYGNLLVEAVQNWQIDEVDVDDAVRRLLRLALRSGRMDGLVHAGVVNTPEHQALAREVAQEAITLLKNDGGLLPLNAQKLRSIAVIGPNAAEARVSGGGSSQVEPPYRISPLAGLQHLLGERIDIRYEQGCDNHVELPLLKLDTLTPIGASGHGLRAEYFNNPDFSGTPVVERIDTLTDFWWYGSGPAEGIPIERFSVRWSAGLCVPESGLYRFKLVNTASVRLMLDGAALIDHSRSASQIADQNYITSATDIELIGGKTYDFRMEFAKYGGDTIANVRLMMARAYRPGDDDRLARAVALAAQCDAAIIFAGMPDGYESEGSDRPDLELPGAQNALIRAVARANKNTVVVLNTGSPVALPWLGDVPAILETYYPGMEGGNAIASILFGEVSPSGKLPVTFPQQLADTPAHGNYPGGREVIYAEGIFVGYRHYDQHAIQPMFPFGHGLTYTSFAYGDLQAPSQVLSGEGLHVSLKVTNTGPCAGKEVVQLYVRDVTASLPRPPRELKAFAKVSLAPGEGQVVNFTLDARALSYYDPFLKTWIAEPGEFEIMVGSSSRDIRVTTGFRLL